ncbi:MAG TPA: flagellar hook capping FlgD N-terminal domain-containing protein [Acidimicrobiia bacterium]|nr:flagellar hook capping FlgD N-terminal domain-containing protein [Acidimicrobiia bacterium]
MSLDPITGTTTSKTQTGMWTTGTKEAPPAPHEMGKDSFLKLLIAQLKYQDPLNPAEGSEFMAQTAQFTVVEKLDALAKSNADMLAGQRDLAGASLLGRTVAYVDAETGEDTSGVVTSVQFGGESVVLKVGDTEVPLASVKEVTREQEGT